MPPDYSDYALFFHPPKSSSITRIDPERNRDLRRHFGVGGELLVCQLTLALVTAEADLHDRPIAALPADIDLVEVERQGFPEEAHDRGLADHVGVAADEEDARAALQAPGLHREGSRRELDAGLEAGLVEQAVLDLHGEAPCRLPVPHHDAGRDAGRAGQEAADDPQRVDLADVPDLAEQLVVRDGRRQARDAQYPVAGTGGCSGGSGGGALVLEYTISFLASKG